MGGNTRHSFPAAFRALLTGRLFAATVVLALLVGMAPVPGIEPPTFQAAAQDYAADTRAGFFFRCVSDDNTDHVRISTINQSNADVTISLGDANLGETATRELKSLFPMTILANTVHGKYWDVPFEGFSAQTETPAPTLDDSAVEATATKEPPP